MKKIKLTQGYESIIDDADFKYLNQFNWQIRKVGKNLYAQRGVWDAKNKKQGCIKMHRFILGLKNNDPTQVDHINGDGLDNRRVNLRLCSKKENIRNRVNKRPIGVVYRKDVDIKGWSASIVVDGKKICLGCYPLKRDAVNIYIDASIFYYKNFSPFWDHSKTKEENNKRCLDLKQRLLKIGSSARRDTTTGHRGVYFNKKGFFQAYITHNGRHVYLGKYDNPIQASEAYKKARLEYHGVQS